jgi:hypothetical protein
MPHSTFNGVSDGPVMALARLRLERAKLKLPCVTRAQAINILRSVQPAPSKNQPHGIVATTGKQDLCRVCHKLIRFGTPCKVCFTGNVNEHINCPKEMNRLFASAVRYVDDVVNGPKDDVPLTMRDRLRNIVTGD